jgi:endonuclease YncB( thermonuclease family)
MRKALFWLALICLGALWLLSDRLFLPEQITAASAKVRDGDTITLNESNYRLFGIDAPEYKQSCKDAKGVDWPCGKAARAMLESHVLAGTITCLPQAEDQYDRKVAKCSSATTPDLGAAMVQAGLAVSPANRGTAPYAEEEGAARSAKRGIWQGDFVMPDAYRAANPR